jgi:pilus assembly protein FimV
MAGIGRAEADALVREQVRAWRQLRAPQLQPAVATAGAGDGAGDAAETAASSADAAAPVADARLEIVPPGGGEGGGTTSGTSAGGEGEMLRTQLQQTREELAARDAEVAELQSRVEELEALRESQRKLIELKDSELAAAQSRLAGDAAAAPTGTTTPVEATPARQASQEPLPWLLAGAVLLVLAGLAWVLFRRRRTPEALPGRRGYDTEALAAGMGVPRHGDAREPVAEDVRHGDAAEPSFSTVARAERAAGRQANVGASPTWHAGGAGVATLEAAVPGDSVDADAARAAKSGREGVELARAYIDLGDEDGARTLLREVLHGRDPAAREEAARLLRELG